MRTRWVVMVRSPDGHTRSYVSLPSRESLKEFFEMNVGQHFEVRERLVPENWRDRLLLWLLRR